MGERTATNEAITLAFQAGDVVNRYVARQNAARAEGERALQEAEKILEELEPTQEISGDRLRASLLTGTGCPVIEDVQAMREAPEPDDAETPEHSLQSVQSRGGWSGHLFACSLASL